MLRFLQFLCKLNTNKIVKTCLFPFVRDCYVNSLDVMFPQFPNHFLLFPMVFPHVFLRFPWVFLLFPLSVSPVSYFRFCISWFSLVTNHDSWKNYSCRGLGGWLGCEGMMVYTELYSDNPFVSNTVSFNLFSKLLS